MYVCVYLLNRKRERERERERDTRAAGEEGVAKRTAQTAPKGAIVIETPFGANNWSIFPKTAIAANAPVKKKTNEMFFFSIHKSKNSIEIDSLSLSLSLTRSRPKDVAEGRGLGTLLWLPLIPTDWFRYVA